MHDARSAPRPGTWHTAPGAARGTEHTTPGTILGTPHSTLGTTRPVRPLLKWAGGKRQLLPALRSFYPGHFDRYFEPFVGSGAVFFDLHASGRLNGARATLTDCNPDLIGCYQMVRDRTDEVAAALARLARGHSARGADHFYEVRTRFNRTRLRQAHAGFEYTPALAAMLIYLNRTGFNGLFRLNGSGEFNVPAGRYVRPRIWDPDHLHAVADVLGKRRVRLALAPFEHVLGAAATGDFVYFDPPYAPLSSTARFTAYTGRTFTLADQARLCEVAVALSERGVSVMVSNSSAPEIAALYEGNPRVAAAGLVVHRLPARRAINSRGSARGPVTEFLLTNLAPRG
jgi:DNA adenine methylase